MQFALMLLLGIAGLLTLAWSFLLGALMIVAAVAWHAKLSPSAEDAFLAWMFFLAAVGVVIEIGGDIWLRIFR